MKHFMTLVALAFAFTAGAQGTTIHEYPWNPDFNNDTFIGAEDLMGLLSTYGTEFGNPPEPCDYDGTPLEELLSGVYDGTIILDSLFVEFELEDESTYFLAGCPDAITDTLVFSTAGMLNIFNLSSAYWYIQGLDSYGQEIQFRLRFYPSTGQYEIKLYSAAIMNLGFAADGFYGLNWWATSSMVEIPFPEDWYLDEDGIHIESGWDEHDWPYYANYLHILPYWHYAE
jgi:hypothetical protein